MKNRDITTMDLGDLILDPENPRLPESLKRSQQSMIDYIATTTSIEELMEAIAENGFFPGEPLIVVPEDESKKRYLVVEGNRRLTAVKLINDPSLCSSPGERMREISNGSKHYPKRIPVVICDNRLEVLPYLGFRHITGVKQWEPLAKARYMEQLFQHTDKRLSVKARYSEIARTIGSRRDHIKRSLDALSVYKVIKDEDFYGVDGLTDESLRFSVLSTALADERIGKFVGLVHEDADGNIIESEAIVDSGNLIKPAINELTHWLFEKDRKGKTKVGESRNIRFLSAVVANAKALVAFRGGSPLKIAYQLTSDLTEDFMELLYQAEALLVEAAGLVATVDYDDDALAVAKRVFNNARLIGKALREKQGDDHDF